MLSLNRAVLLVPLLFAQLLEPVAANPLERLFAPKAELWARWAVHAESPGRAIDHSAWQAFLQRYVVPSADGIHRVAYAAVSAEDRGRLDDYVRSLSAEPVSQNTKAQQLAYWINLYNALTLRLVLDHYPVESIRDIDISPGLFASGPWDKALVEVEGEAMTLNDIEHRVLRPIWGDPRIHYAVNCASIGCPNLQREAFTAGNSGRLLDAAARDYINHPRSVEVQGEGVVLSSIYNWFAPDFEVDGGVLAHLRRYAAPALAGRLAQEPHISGYAYDWTLNEAAKVALP